MSKRLESTEGLRDELERLRRRIAELEAAGHVGAKESLRWLSESAMEFVTLSPDRDIYDFIGRKVKQLVGRAIVSVNSIDEQKGVLRVRSLSGIKKATLERAEQLLGRRVLGTNFEGVHEEAKTKLTGGSLETLEGRFYQMFFERVPKPVCLALEKLLGVQGVHSIGLRRKGRLFGNLTVIALKGARLNKDALEAFASQASAALEHRQTDVALRQERDRLGRLLDMQERDRKLIAYEIHDGFVPLLTAALMQLESHLAALGANPAGTSGECCRDAVRLLRDGIADARRLMGGLRPPTLDEFGVVAAINSLAESFQDEDGPEISFVHNCSLHRLAPPLEMAVFRIVQEGLTNALRHSGTPRVKIRLERRANRLWVEVQDWGAGFDPAVVAHGHFGLEGIRQRAQIFGGQATIDSAPDRGTRITVELPLVEAGAGKPGA